MRIMYLLLTYHITYKIQPLKSKWWLRTTYILHCPFNKHKHIFLIKCKKCMATSMEGVGKSQIITLPHLYITLQNTSVGSWEGAACTASLHQPNYFWAANRAVELHIPTHLPPQLRLVAKCHPLALAFYYSCPWKTPCWISQCQNLSLCYMYKALITTLSKHCTMGMASVIVAKPFWKSILYANSCQRFT